VRLRGNEKPQSARQGVTLVGTTATFRRETAVVFCGWKRGCLCQGRETQLGDRHNCTTAALPAGHYQLTNPIKSQKPKKKTP